MRPEGEEYFDFDFVFVRLIMSELKVLNRKRGTLKSKVTRIANFLSDKDTTKDSFVISVKINNLEVIKNQLEDLRLEYYEITKDEQLDEVNKVLEEIEEELEKTEVRCLHFKSQLKNLSTHADNGVKLKLPDIPLPKFSGNIEEWHNFKAQFNALIATNKNLDESHKLYYLQSSLTGNAKQIQTTEDTFVSLFKALQERYEHKRLLVNKHITELLSLEKINHESAVELRSLLDKVIKQVRALNSLDLELDQLSSNILINIVLTKVDKESRKLFEMSLKTSELPVWEDLIDVLKTRCTFLENIQGHSNEVKAKVFHKARSFIVDSNTNVSCVICNSQKHSIFKCSEFLRLNPKQRFNLVKKFSLCINCLNQSHKVIDCKSKLVCKLCSKRHNSLLHYSNNTEVENVNTVNKCPPLGRNEESSTDSNSHIQTDISKTMICASASCSEHVFNVILATAIVYVKDVSGNKYPLRCICDSGSQINAITIESANLLRLKKEKTNIPLTGLNGTFIPVKAHVSTEISNESNDFVRTADFLVVPKITNVCPSTYLKLNLRNLNKNIKFADPEFFRPARIDALLGVELFFDMLRSGKLYIENSRLILQETAFGYIVSGSSLAKGSQGYIHCGLIQETLNLEKTLRNFWEIESVDNSSPVLSKEELECENHFNKTHYRTTEGRYVVNMPLKTDKVLGESRTTALDRLNSLSKRLARNPNLKELYIHFIEEYKDLGHMEEVSSEVEPDGCYYFPHHGILRPEKSSTKLRVVFNGSASTSNGVSLNQLQLNGKIPQQDLFSIMLRFRKHVFAFTADIRMMYRQILIEPTQRDLQRILWRENPTDSVKTYRLNTVTYGTKNAPYLATRALRQLCDDEEQSFPAASFAAREDFYIDDILTGSHDLESAVELKRQMILLLQRGGMTLHKWNSNHVSLINHESCNGNYSFDDFNQVNSVKALGVLWRPILDCFSYKLTIQPQANSTKRTILSDISRIFDPLGLIGPVVTKAKLFMKDLWMIHLDWDTPLPEPTRMKWLEYVSLLPNLENLSIPRYFDNNNKVTLHGFADASSVAYGAAIYAQCNISNVTSSVHLLCSKSRVAPVKPVTIPRLELCAALLLSHLMERVISALKLRDYDIVLWSDSTIVLAWLKKPPHELKPFVANRVATIQELTKNSQWNHVSSSENPADLLSRGLMPDQIQTQDLWWHGPSFLRDSAARTETCDLEHATILSDFTCELKQQKNTNLTSVVNNDVISYLVFSNNHYLKLIRILSFVYRFLNNCRRSLPSRVGPIARGELEFAETKILHYVQRKEFSNEFNSLKEGKPLTGKSSLRSLNPFIDDKGILRVGGRLQNAEVNWNKKHQIILPGKNRVTYLILECFHKRYLHVGPQALLFHARQKFWPVGGRNLTRKIVHNCVTCVKNKPVILEQLMGQPPPERVNISPPFSNSGVDFAGPFFVRNRNQRKGPLHRIYVAIFVCMATKAIHIEMVTDLTSESFIATLKRFFARRGKCSTLFSDNATNFVGAYSELKRLHNLLRHPDEIVGRFLSADGIVWKFIPPRAPNFGGLWEAGVKSFKHHFKRVVGNANLNYDEFLSVITEIEGILNSRPLTPISSDINDFEALTPGHFLIGRAINTIPEPDITDTSYNRLSRWKRVERMIQLVWKKWSLDYLSHFQQRHKWQFLKDNIKPGMMVILREDGLPKCKWILGRISEVIYGRDGCIRVVNVRTQHGLLKRPISKVCILPIETDKK